MYNDQEITAIPINIFPNRSPENFVPFSITGSKAINTTPTKPIVMPNFFLLFSFSLKKTKRKKAVKRGTAAYKSVPIVAVVVLIPRTNKAIFIVANKEKRVSLLKSLRKLVLKRNGEIIIPAIKKRIKAKLNGGKLTNPIFITACVAPPKTDASNIKIIAFCLSLIESKQVKDNCHEEKCCGVPSKTFRCEENPEGKKRN